MSFLRKMEKRKAMEKSSEKAATDSTTTEGKIYIRLHFFGGYQTLFLTFLRDPF